MIAYINTQHFGTFYPPVCKVSKGRYGEYAVLNGINRSENWMRQNGWLRQEISKADFDSKLQEWNEYCASERKRFDDIEMEERKETLLATLKCAPIEISKKDGEICYTADLQNTDMIAYYKGAGKATAYVKDGKLVGFHYGHRQPIEGLLAGAIVDKKIKVMMSCTQVCFI